MRNRIRVDMCAESEERFHGSVHNKNRPELTFAVMSFGNNVTFFTPSGVEKSLACLDQLRLIINDLEQQLLEIEQEEE